MLQSEGLPSARPAIRGWGLRPSLNVQTARVQSWCSAATDSADVNFKRLNRPLAISLRLTLNV